MSMIINNEINFEENAFNLDGEDECFVLTNNNEYSFDSDSEITPIKKLAKLKDEDIPSFTLNLCLDTKIEGKLDCDDDESNSVCTDETGCNSRNVSSSSVSSFFVKKQTQKSQFSKENVISKMFQENLETEIKDLKLNVTQKCNKSKEGKENNSLSHSSNKSILKKMQENVSLNTLTSQSPIHFFKKF